MTSDRSLLHLERAAYRASYGDGIIDLFVGLSIAWIGTAWIWLSDLAGVAGVFPAVFLTAVLAIRKRLVESRAGYVKWSPPRLRWERRNIMLVFAGGVAMFLLGIAAFVASADGSSLFDSVGPAILAWLLALMAFGLAFVMSAWRMLGYAAVLVVSGAMAAAAGANPGWPLLASGAAITVVGGVMLARFLRENPRIEADA